MSAYQALVERIHNLSVEQQELYVRASQHELTPAQRRRLAQIRETLPSLWLKRKGMRPQVTDPLELLMQARWNRSANQMHSASH